MNTGRQYRNMSMAIERQNNVIFYLFMALCFSLALNITQFTYHSGYTYSPAHHSAINTISGIETIKTPFERIADIKAYIGSDNIVNEENAVNENEIVNEVIPAPMDAVDIEPEPVVEETPKEVFPETQILSNEKVEKENLTKAIETIAPALLGCEDAILYNYETYGIKPSYQLAVFCLESGYGESNLASKKNNISSERAYAHNGKTAFQNAKSFETKSDCVLSFGKLMANNYNLKSLESVANKYCPPNSDKWVTSVKSLMNRFDTII